MKKTIFSTLMLLSFFAMLITVGAQAQTDAAMTAQVPFEFSVNRQTLPADKYEVQVKLIGGNWALQINRHRRTEGIYFVTQATIRGAAPDAPQLIFHRYGEEYFLAEVRLSYERDALKLPRSHAEEEVMAAMQDAAPQIVAVNLTQP
ncbi:MAG TPA: hypothetical protein VKA60_05680 [Blastocatellia bacterium]|nr:hypothetical protein [Blastocatellia bacterium]